MGIKMIAKRGTRMFCLQRFRQFMAMAVLSLFLFAALFLKGQEVEGQSQAQPGQTLPSQPLPKAPQAQIFPLTPTVGPFTEPAIAVNPANPQQVVGVFQDNVHASFSTDAGHTWNLAENVDPKNYRVSGDVSVA